MIEIEEEGNITNVEGGAGGWNNESVCYRKLSFRISAIKAEPEYFMITTEIFASTDFSKKKIFL